MKKSKLLASLLLGCGAAGVAGLIASKLLVDGYLSSKGIEKFLSGKPLLSSENAKKLRDNDETRLGKLFFDSTPSCDISIKNRSGETINALFLNNASGENKFVLFCHGFASSPRANANIAMRYYDMGYSVLMPYQRGHSGSSHKYSTMGWYERLDIVDWLRFIDSAYPECKIVLHGISMGGAAVMMATGEKLPKSVACAIEDCGYTSVYEEYEAQTENMLHLPAHPTVDIFRAAVKKFVGFDIKEASAKKQVIRSETPTLFIHGDADSFVPFHMVKIVYAFANCEKDLLVVSGADHATASTEAPDIYWSKVKEFISRYV